LAIIITINLQEKDCVHVFPSHLPNVKSVKLAASVVGHPNNGEMVPTRLKHSVHHSLKTICLELEKCLQRIIV
jgi:hypothetical protein